MQAAAAFWNVLCFSFVSVLVGLDRSWGLVWGKLAILLSICNKLQGQGEVKEILLRGWI